MKRHKLAMITGIILYIAGLGLLFSPLGQRVEEEFGLALLFKLRGPRPSTEHAVIVNIDHQSSQKLGLDTHYSKWSRTIHAELIDKLILYGATVIAFDMHFAEEKKKVDDRVFAEAIQRAGNVILVEKLEHKTVEQLSKDSVAGNIEMDILIPPIQLLADSALALAPFPLPKLPVRVDKAWLFKDTSGDIPTLPAVTFQATVLESYDALHKLLRKHVSIDNKVLPERAQQAIRSPGLIEIMRNLRMVFQQNPYLRDKLLNTDLPALSAAQPTTTNQLIALINLYSGKDIVSIDFHGPPATHTTLTYLDILSPDKKTGGEIAALIQGKAVFVGAARRTWSNQKDGFYTVFSQEDGLDLSGVELAATVFTNLCENRLVRKLTFFNSIAFVFLCAGIACLLSFFLQPILSVPLLLGSMGLAIFSAHKAFSVYAVQIPLIIPVIILPAIAFLIAMLSAYLSEQRERRHISKALGYYLPANVVEELAKDLSFIKKGDQMVYSACLMTDAKNYTTLSENLPPEEMSVLIKDYYQHLFGEVKNCDGLVCNVIGDSMLAMWPSSQPLALLRENACKAALQIAQSVDEFNRKHPDTPLPTRIGLHSGHLLMGNIGAEDHFEYAPVGDIVNTASRIEGLNKQLGTRILATKEAVEDVTNIGARELGMFLLGGKSQPVQIYEIHKDVDSCKSIKKLYTGLFPEALALFRRKRWEEAQHIFEQCLLLNPGDGPSQFYIRICKTYISEPPLEDLQGIIKVGK